MTLRALSAFHEVRIMRSPLDYGDHHQHRPGAIGALSILRRLCPPGARISMLGDFLSCYPTLAKEVGVPILPRDVRKVLELLESEPSRPYSIEELAAACGVARRTLQEHFRRFVGR